MQTLFIDRQLLQIGLKMPPALSTLAQYSVGNKVAEKMLLSGALFSPEEAKYLPSMLCHLKEGSLSCF